MKWAIGLVGLCSAVFGLMPGMAHAFLPLFEQRIADWVLIAHTASDVGSFTHCSLLKKTPDGTAVIFVVGPNGAWRLGLGGSSWTLPAGKTAPVVYRVDANAAQNGEAFSAGSKTIAVPLPGDGALFDQVAAGKVLHLEFKGESRRIDLDGAATTFPALLECVRQYRPEVVEAVVTKAPPAVADLRAATRQALAEAAGWARQISAEGGLSRVEPLTSEQMAEARWGGFFGKASAGWYNQDTVGKLDVYQPAPITLSNTAEKLIETSTRKCDGDYTYRRGGRDDQVIGIHLDCRVGGNFMRRGIVLFKDKNGFLYQAAFVSLPGQSGEDAERAAEDLRRAALALLAR